MTLVLMTYVNRSGSTFFSNLLSSSGKICVCPEGDWLVSYFLEDPAKPFVLTDKTRDVLESGFREDEKLRTWNMDEGIFEKLASGGTNFQAFYNLLDQYRHVHKPSAFVIVFKAERLAALISVILKEANSGFQVCVISIVRNPCAVINSQLQTRWPGTKQMMADDTVKAAVYWRDHVKCILRLMNTSQVQVLRYEDLINATGETLKMAGDHIGVNLDGVDPESGDIMERLPESHLAIHQRVTQKPQPERIDSWKEFLSGKDIYLIQRICKRGMGKMGYGATGDRILIVDEITLSLRLLGNYLSQLRKKSMYHLKRRIRA